MVQILTWPIVFSGLVMTTKRRETQPARASLITSLILDHVQLSAIHFKSRGLSREAVALIRFWNEGLEVSALARLLFSGLDRLLSAKPRSSRTCFRWGREARSWSSWVSDSDSSPMRGSYCLGEGISVKNSRIWEYREVRHAGGEWIVLSKSLA